MADPTAQEVQDCGGFPSQTGIGTALSVAINQVNELLASSALSAQTTHDIKMYLAAHYTSLMQSSGALTVNKLGEAREHYSDIYQPGLFSTRFGQMVCMLDTSGVMSAAAQQAVKPTKKALFTHVEPTPFTDSDDPSIQ